jgi:hypothetical protein
MCGNRELERKLGIYFIHHYIFICKTVSITNNALKYLLADEINKLHCRFQWLEGLIHSNIY